VTEPVQTTIEFANYTFLLTFPGISVETNSLDDGYTAGFGIHRELFSWIGLGLEAGGSFGHSETVVTGDIPYSLNGVPQGNIPFTIDYEAYTLHATPILKVGPWIPLGRSFAVKPYATGGAGWSQVQEKVIFSAAGTDVRLGRRTTSALGTQYGAGVDVRISESGLIGAQYQAQKVDFDPKDIELSNWLLRFSYLF
jgi:hypothetical protein